MQNMSIRQLYNVITYNGVKHLPPFSPQFYTNTVETVFSGTVTVKNLQFDLK